MVSRVRQYKPEGEGYREEYDGHVDAGDGENVGGAGFEEDAVVVVGNAPPVAEKDGEDEGLYVFVEVWRNAHGEGVSPVGGPEEGGESRCAGNAIY